MMDRYAHVAQYVYGSVWALLPAKMAAILSLLEYRAAGGRLTDEEIQQRIGAAQRTTPAAPGAIAVLPIYGTLANHAGMMAESSGGVSTDRLAAAFRRAVADPGVGAIVLDIDSGGGAVSGIPELASEIYQARGAKPIKAVSNTLMASAALWLGSAADEVIVSPSAQIGSVGVIAAHQDVSEALAKEGVKTTLITAGRYKGEGSPYAPLDDEARAELQRRVDEAHAMFVRDLAKFRGVGVETVRSEFGEGRVFGAREAIRRGMADREGTIDDVIAELASPRRRSNAARASARMLTI